MIEDMIWRKENNKVKTLKNHHGGPGQLFCLNRIDLKRTRGSMLIHNLYYKDSGTIPHNHVKDNFIEHYYILSGEGEYYLNGETSTVRAGDVCFMGPGDSHALLNKQYEPLEFFSIVEFLDDSDVL